MGPLKSLRMMRRQGVGCAGNQRPRSRSGGSQLAARRSRRSCGSEPMAVISKNQVSLAGEFAVLSRLAAVFALALLTPAVGADISAQENFVVIWGQIERGMTRSSRRP
jgi:hypothetical protein